MRCFPLIQPNDSVNTKEDEDEDEEPKGRNPACPSCDWLDNCIWTVKVQWMQYMQTNSK